MVKLLLLAMVVFLMSGRATALTPDFPDKVKEDLGIIAIVYHSADWIQGSYGYNSFFGSMITRGALVAGEERVSFLRFDENS